MTPHTDALTTSDLSAVADYLASPDEVVRWSAAANPIVTDEQLTDLVRDPSQTVRSSLAYLPRRMPREVIEALVHSADPRDRCAVAQRRSDLTETDRIVLLSDADPDVRLDAVACAPGWVLSDLFDDVDGRVQDEAARTRLRRLADPQAAHAGWELLDDASER